MSAMGKRDYLWTKVCYTKDKKESRENRENNKYAIQNGR